MRRSGQLQLDVYGEMMDALHLARGGRLGARPTTAWALQRALIEHLETIWREPDDGIWEVRGGRRHFTHSKVMAWVAFDRVVRSAETYGLDGPVDRWRAVRDESTRRSATQGSTRDRQLRPGFGVRSSTRACC